ncbi:hypothetical protein CapIbe_008500 [Capra ibex]
MQPSSARFGRRRRRRRRARPLARAGFGPRHSAFGFEGFRSILHHPGPGIQHRAEASAFWSVREPPSGSQALVQIVQAGCL